VHAGPGAWTPPPYAAGGYPAGAGATQAYGGQYPAAPAPVPWQPYGLPSIPASVFYGEPEPAAWLPDEGVPTGVRADSWWIRFAHDQRRLGLVFLAVGFIAVFLRQATFLLQLLFGAPIFEEAFKFGLAAYLASFARRSGTLLVLACLAAGAGFGVMEHYLTYAEEGRMMFLRRIAFHATATSLSAVTYLTLRGDPRVIVRWGATIPAVFVHYLNNAGALFLGIATALAASDGERQAIVFVGAIQAILLLLHGVVPLAPGAIRAMAHGVVGFLARRV